MALNLDFVGPKWEAKSDPNAPVEQEPTSGPVTVNGLVLPDVGPKWEPSPTKREAIEQKSAEAMTADIIAAQDAGEFPQGKREEFSLWNTLSGNDRETNATRELPELADIGVEGLLGPERFKTLSDKLGGVNIAAGLLTSFRPTEAVKILSEASGGELQVRPDEAGNIILSIDGREAILNKPGMSKMDLFQLGAVTSAFWPTGKVVQTGGGIIANMVKMAGAGAATQGVIEAQQASAGGDFDAGDVGMSGIMAGGFQGVFQGLAQRILPAIRQKITSGSAIPDEIRIEFRAAAEKAGMSADDVTDDLIRESLARADDRPMTTTEMLGQQGEAEFGVPLTRGQRSLDPAQLSFEDSARVGMRGNKAQRTLLNFQDDVQRPAVDAAKDALEESVGPLDGRAGGVIKQGVREAEQVADEAVGAAYEAVGDATLSADGVRGLFLSMKQITRSTEFDNTLPETAKVLTEINKALRTVQKAVKGTGGIRLKDVDLNRLEQMRRRLNTHLGSAQGSDKRQVTLIKRQFDDYIDTAVQNALFSGDEQAISALKNSRGLFSEYAKKFRANPQKARSGRGTVDGDKPGKIIEKIVEADPSDTEVVNAIFGASGINNSAGGAMVRRFREILGPESEGWAAIRREATRRIFQSSRINGKDYLSADKSLTALDKALEKSPEMMKSLFTKEEIGTLRRFLVHIKRTQADMPKSRENPSGTTQKAFKAATDLFPKVAAIFGSPQFLVMSEAGKRGVTMAKNTGATNAVRPFSTPRPIKPGLVAGSTALGSQELN